MFLLFYGSYVCFLDSRFEEERRFFLGLAAKFFFFFFSFTVKVFRDGGSIIHSATVFSEFKISKIQITVQELMAKAINRQMEYQIFQLELNLEVTSFVEKTDIKQIKQYLLFQ